MEDGSTYAALGQQVKGLSTTQTLIVAASAGLSVANVYYAQPLLDIMALDFGMSSAATGSIVTLTQIGYGLGLIFIVPIGDLFDRRCLIVGQGVLSAIVLMVVATARTETILFSGMAAMGLLAVVAQVLVGYAAALATVAQRGKVIGTVTSGIVMGILAARSIAGSVADLGGWRAVYMLSATLTLLMVCLLLRALPSHHPEQRSETYISAVSSVPIMILREPVLLIRGILALLIFAAFSTFWTALVLPLTNQPFSYSHTQVGLFGLVGLAGAVASTYAGKLADRGHAHWTTGISLLLLLISWGWIAFLPVSIPILLIGVVLLDLAVQAVHVTSLSIIVALNLQKSGRLIGGYMVFYSVGSAVGAIATTAIYARFDWSGVSALGATFSLGALALWLATSRFSNMDRGVHFPDGTG
ncbi:MULTISPECIES: MFS transporter [Rhizobium]|uniref:MFS transporter n=1 Tax=Rhizobium rhododendri TaxID=2506430 RepID=A0ABY8ISJ3_9HYPH|nr:MULTISPECIES: MFS transporter [Rhizobium]MBZ5759388.1 MFS transporter [Rhizobium sp. VS19-DR96]MBZ5765879.1 MFS transporter [Rhizobium sp. VS19-DR129.2]MBZ5773963.1 MFS transporter [Rhizobium sp. VS19-DRK62.2]MBZ5785035.1 MFS transporter [Rhizobium sp. VS19-DR121]MBZ5801888.1 MFS transporter [Rhizobium sp. VS19-DR181]